MSKVLAFKVPLTETESFRIQEDKSPFFYDRYHHHVEWQITNIIDGNGTLFLGDSISSFTKGDLFFIGSKVPHVFKSSAAFYDKKNGLQSHSVSIFFSESVLGVTFFDLPELHQLKEILLKAKYGLRIQGQTSVEVKKKLSTIAEKKTYKRVIAFIEILGILAESEELSTLSNIDFNTLKKTDDHHQLNDVFQLVMDNYQRPISLGEAAALTNRSVSAFCRYFKLSTRKTFIQFVNELRISMACKLLQQENKSIGEISYEVGFNNISNFNRQFKLLMKMSPSAYVRKMKKN